MKRIACFIMGLVLMAVMLSGCRGPSAPENGKLNVVATIFPPYDFTRQIAGERVNLSLLIPPGGESHTYEPTPADIITIENADLFLYVGGENDTWLDGILENIDTSSMKIIRLVDCVDTLEEETVEGMQAPHSHEEHGDDPEADEHVWTSPVNAVKIAQVISAALCESDPANAAFYQTNLLQYEKELLGLDAGFRTVIEQAGTREVVFGDRFPFRYFAEEYGLTYYAAFPGCSAESEPSAKTIAFLIDKVKADKVTTVFYIEFSNHKAADTIAEATGAKTALFHSCHNVTADQMAQGITYLSLMQQNLQTLKQALQVRQ